MDILILDIKGKFAHFRKFYTNSSSLSYSIPPRTTLIGIISAVLGYERDSYYELFSRENFNIAVRGLSPVNRIMQSLNYIKATGNKYLIEPEEHTQIPFEILCSEDSVTYRIYLHHKDKTIMDEIQERVKNKRYVYPPYMGAAPFSCSIDYVDRVLGNLIEENSTVSLCTALRADIINQGTLDIFTEELQIVKERMPAEILKDRVIGQIENYIFDQKGKSIKASIKEKAVTVKYNYFNEKVTENISFM